MISIYSNQLTQDIANFARTNCISIQQAFCKFNSGDLDILAYVQNSFLPIA
jgi:hypothetical protein